MTTSPLWSVGRVRCEHCHQLLASNDLEVRIGGGPLHLFEAAAAKRFGEALIKMATDDNS